MKPSVEPVVQAPDPRLRAFAVMFAFGTVLHELEFALELLPIGPLSEYMERWTRAVPSTGWSSKAGLALHGANIALCLLIVVLPRPRLLLSLLASTFFLSVLASPDRYASHSGMMTGGLAIVLALTLAERGERVVRRSAADRVDWERWTLIGLAGISVLTWLFAFFYKLNPVWFSSDSSAPRFLLRPLAPLLHALGRPEGITAFLGAIAIYGTLVVEFVLPVLLLVPRTRLFGCWIGLIFHLPMIAAAIADFPILSTAFLAVFLSRDEMAELLRRVRIWPSRAQLVATATVCAGGVWLVGLSPRFDLLPAGSAASTPLGRVMNTVLTAGQRMARMTLDQAAVVIAANVIASIAAFALVTHLIFTLGIWLWNRRLEESPGERRAVAWATPQSRGLWTARTAAAPAIVGLIWMLFAYSNLGSFLGMPTGGSMIMYSGISPDRRNHFLMPRVPLADWHSYTEIVHFDARGPDTTEARDFRAFVEWLRENKPRSHVLLNLVRYHMDRICRSGPFAVGLSLRDSDGMTLTFEDVCTEPHMRRYTVIPIGSRCMPECGTVFREWARGELGQ